VHNVGNLAGRERRGDRGHMKAFLLGTVS